MAVITLSRQMGSGGDEIALRVCQALGCQLFTKALVMESAAKEGIFDSDMIDYNEDNHKVSDFLNHLFNQSLAEQYQSTWIEGTALTNSYLETTPYEEKALELVRKAVWIAYQRGNMLIVGRGGQVILMNQPDVLHVRVVAPIELRAERLVHSRVVEGPAAGAEVETAPGVDLSERIRARDAASADYVRRFYHYDWDDPLLYHLVINTGRVSIDQAVLMIAAMIE